MLRMRIAVDETARDMRNAVDEKCQGYEKRRGKLSGMMKTAVDDEKRRG